MKPQVRTIVHFSKQESGCMLVNTTGLPSFSHSHYMREALHLGRVESIGALPCKPVPLRALGRTRTGIILRSSQEKRGAGVAGGEFIVNLCPG
jgi:hypothetical protein